MTIEPHTNLATTTVPTPPITPGPDLTADIKYPDIIIVGEAIVDDAPAMAALGGATFAATFGHSILKEDLDEFLKTTYSAESVVAEFTEPEKTWLVAKSSQGKITGIAQLFRGETHSSIVADINEVAEMRKLYVDSSAHGQGIGSKLIAAMEQLARDEGIKQLWLSVWEENIKAQKLYGKLGYKRTGDYNLATGTGFLTGYVFVKYL